MKHTPGPWRWEVNLKDRSVSLCGGVPKFDLTVVDFVRWGMGGASPRFREDMDNLNVMCKAERWAAVVPGREHHAHWFQGLNHPDARLIAAAPEMLAFVRETVERFYVKDGKEWCFCGGILGQENATKPCLGCQGRALLSSLTDTKGSE